ncbi:MAG: hypothetical protein WCP97_01280 [bacterium]
MPTRLYTIRQSGSFKKKLKKIVRKDIRIKEVLLSKIQLLRLNPKDKILRSHKVTSSKFGEVFSSYITGNIRLIWKYDENDRIVLCLLDIGGHDDVYN